MKKLILLVLFLSSLSAISAPKHIGVIVESKDNWERPIDVIVTYEYDGKGTLILLLENIEMNAAAQGVTGSIEIENGKIIIKPREIYIKRGPVDSLKLYSIRYSITNISSGMYSLIHDDSESEGQDQVGKVNLDLSTERKATIMMAVTIPERPNAADPFGDSQ